MIFQNYTRFSPIFRPKKSRALRNLEWPAKPWFWSADGKVENMAACVSLRRGSLRFLAVRQSEGWARQDSNLGPRDYESPALTAELQAPVFTH